MTVGIASRFLLMRQLLSGLLASMEGFSVVLDIDNPLRKTARRRDGVLINPLPFVSAVDSVETPRGSGAQRTVEYSICSIVPVPPGRYANASD